MTIEVISTEICSGVVVITAINASEERLQMIERNRIEEDRMQTLTGAFDTTQPREFYACRRWLRAQSVTRGAHTWGEALESIVGRVFGTCPPYKYRVYDSTDF